MMRNGSLVQSPGSDLSGDVFKHYSELKKGTVTLPSAMGFLTGECWRDEHGEVPFSKLGDLGLAQDMGPSPKNLGIA